VHCKLIFDSRSHASTFLTQFGGEPGSLPTEKWKDAICRCYEINDMDGFDKTTVKIEWAQHQDKVLQYPAS